MAYGHHTNELFKFIKLLPEGVVSESMDNIAFRNRDERRKYEKLKTLDNKLETLLVSTSFRVPLIENLHQKYNSEYVFDDSSSYDEIIQSINHTNYLSKILYVLYRCCDENFDKLHFTDFMQSPVFQKTLKGEWEMATAAVHNTDDIINETDIVKPMLYFIGNIELRTTFYNFKPQFAYDSNNKTVINETAETFRTLFPEHGSLNLAYRSLGDQAHEFLKSKNIDKIDDVTDDTPYSSIFVVCFYEDELEDNNNERIKKKLDLMKLFDAGVDLNDRIIPIDKYNMYKVVTPELEINDESFAGMIPINEKYYAPDNLVLLKIDEKLFGPYKLQERSFDGEKYVRPDCGMHQYVVEYYNPSDYEIITFEKHPYLRDTVYTDVAHIETEPHYQDVITDSILLTKLIDNIDINLLVDNPDEFDRLYSNSPFLGNIPEHIRDERITKIKAILQNTTDYDETKRKIVTSLVKNLGNDVFELLGDKIKESKIYNDLVVEANTSRDEAAKLRSDAEKLHEKIAKLINEKTLLEEVNDAKTFVDTEKLESLEEENIVLKEKLSLVENFEKLLEDFNELQERHKREKQIYDEKVIEVKQKNQELADLQSSMQTFIKQELGKANATKMLQAAFDPYISNAMIEAAEKCHSNTEENQYESIAKEMSSIACSEFDRETLIDQLVNGIQQFRKYSKNEILNMYICFSQNFLTVFSGEPGTGKTSICNILANSLGLNHFGVSDEGISKNRYVPVSVERGWSSKRDLIGYFNPLTKKYDRSNAKIYDGLMILNKERHQSRFPFIVLLDEANLSPIEYYWADFMRAADNMDSETFINIGIDEDICVPKTLRFLATINNDQTTEKLSPRLIDRAWIIKLPKTNIFDPSVNIDECFKNTILWSDIEKTFVSTETQEIALKNLVEQIYKLFDEHHLTVSPRVQQSIKRYVCIAQEIMEDEVGCNKKEKALDFSIVQKLLPKINGYYKDYERLFTALIQICDENHLKMTKEALISMQEFQRQNMGYCQYLV